MKNYIRREIQAFLYDTSVDMENALLNNIFHSFSANYGTELVNNNLFRFKMQKKDKKSEEMTTEMIR